MLAVSEIDHYRAEFQEFSKKQKDRKWLQTFRKQAMTRLENRGFPSTRDEDWRFTNVSPILRAGFVPAKAVDVQKVIHPLDVRPHLVFINGIYSKDLSQADDFPEGVVIRNLREAIDEGKDLVINHLGNHVSSDFSGFTAMNSAFFNDGVFIFLPDAVSLKTPIHLLYFTTGYQEHFTVPRNLIIASAQCRATIVETYFSESGSRFFTNAVTEISVGKAASIEHVKIQMEGQKSYHIASTAVYQERDSQYSCYSISLGAALGREDLGVVLAGDGASTILNGLYIPAGEQHMDHHTFLDHAQPHTTSFELYKGILYGKSKAVFNGKIVVRNEAQQTNARQVNRNLLISEGAQVNTKPELQILADDVKCSHGATIGQLDPDSIFYFKSRGMDESLAVSMLTYGFAAEVLEGLKDTNLAEKIQHQVSSKLHQQGT